MPNPSNEPVVLLDHIDDLVQSCDPTGKFMYVNKKWRETLGYTFDEALALSFPDIISSDHLESCEKIFASLMDSELNKVEGVRTKFVSKDKKIIEVEGNVTVVKDQGKITQTIGVFRDLSERTQAEIMYEELFENLRSGVAVYEIQDDGDKIIFKDFNKAAELLEKKKKSDVIGQEIRSVFSGAEKMGLVRILKEVYRTGKPQYFPEGKYQTEDGNIFWRENYIYRVGKDTVVAIYSDITAKIKERDSIKEHAEDLEKINKLMVGRELEMARLKERITELEQKVSK